jgi:hypothetical protein
MYDVSVAVRTSITGTLSLFILLTLEVPYASLLCSHPGYFTHVCFTHITRRPTLCVSVVFIFRVLYAYLLHSYQTYFMQVKLLLRFNYAKPRFHFTWMIPNDYIGTNANINSQVSISA